MREAELRFIKFLLCDRRGATAVEYALILGLVALVIMVAVGDVGIETRRLWDDVANKVGAA
jgi:Flp pilus assembly pilin Flp